ncbi:MAG: U32 family peptidase, partial [Oscillospiraceae bacterium]
MAVHNLEGALLLSKRGYSRVILARELSLEQVEYITKNCGIETEIFVHGALCVSLSGQCYASAFLGGRSGNRGRCAGTCRLPMSAKANLDDNHLSLKDLCALDMLPQLEAMGVKCVKIEGRMRTPEYVASAVDSAKKALGGLEYDKEILADVFSRSGFTNGFLEVKLDRDVFGVRTMEDSLITKETLPYMRQLYRREGQYVPINISFSMGEKESVLSVSDGENRFEKIITAPLQDTQNDFEKALKTALEKLGGTPFFAQEINISLIEGKYLPLSEINAGRRELTANLLEKRSQPKELKTQDYLIPTFAPRNSTVKYIARFESAQQIPMDLCCNFEYIILPIKEYQDCAMSLKDKIVIELPRDMMNGTQELKSEIEQAKELQFNRFCVQNIGHIPLVEGCEIFSSFTLNVSNSLSADEYFKMGVEYLTLSPEITLEQIKRIGGGVKTIVIGYGHIPIMLTKACPLQNVRSCAECDGLGFLTDRKGMKLPVVCHGKIKGYREIFNPVPLYLAERQREVTADYISLCFTIEDKERTRQVTELFLKGKPLDTEFTRGLYYKASI